MPRSGPAAQAHRRPTDADFQAPLPALRQVHPARCRRLSVLRHARSLRARSVPQLQHRHRGSELGRLPPLRPGADQAGRAASPIGAVRPTDAADAPDSTDSGQSANATDAADAADRRLAAFHAGPGDRLEVHGLRCSAGSWRPVLHGLRHTRWLAQETPHSYLKAHCTVQDWMGHCVNGPKRVDFGIPVSVHSVPRWRYPR